MKPLNSFFSRTGVIFFTVATLVGVGGSIVLWQILLPGDEVDAAADPTNTTETTTFATTSRDELKASDTATLAKILELKSPIDRTLAILSLVDGMKRDQILGLLNRTLKFDLSPAVRSVQTTLIAELVWADPAAALAFVWKTERMLRDQLISVVFAEWARLDLDDALHGTTTLEGAMKNIALRAIFFSRPDLGVAERRALLETLGTNSMLLHGLVTEASTNQSVHDPVEFLQTIASDEIADEQQILALYQLTDYWYDREGNASIGAMLDEIFTYFQDQHLVVRDLVKKVATFDPKTAWKHVLTLSSDVQKQLAPGVIAVWGVIDFEEAHRTVLEADGLGNLSTLLTHLYAGWSRRFPEQALAHLDEVPPDVARHMSWQLVNRLPRQVLLEQLSQHGTLGSDTPYALNLLIDRWSVQDPEAAVEWLLTNLPGHKWLTQDNLLRGLINLGSVDAERAFTIALDQPKSASSSGMEYSLIVELTRRGQFEGIRELLKQVRKPVQHRAYEIVGMHLSKHGRLNEAIELANQLPESDWSDYFGAITSDSVWYSTEQFIDKISSLPKAKIRKEVARRILNLMEMTFYPNRLSITESDLQYLRSLVDQDE